MKEAHIIAAAAVKAQPWRNGGGITRELLAWTPPGAAQWALRISVANIDADGPFSALPGVRRWIAVVEGAGIVLESRGNAVHLACGAEPWAFDGALAPHCRLLGGATRDLNLMVRAGQGRMHSLAAKQTYDPAGARNGVYALRPGVLIDAAGARRALDAHSLLWDEAAARGPWRFETQDDTPGTAAYGLSFTPEAGAEVLG